MCEEDVSCEEDITPGHLVLEYCPLSAKLDIIYTKLIMARYVVFV